MLIQGQKMIAGTWIRRRLRYAGRKQRFHSENTSNVLCPLYGGEFKNGTITDYFDLCLRKTRSGKSRDYRDIIVFEKLRIQNVFRPHENAKPAFSYSTVSMSFLENLRFRNGLVWTEGLTVETKLAFSNSSGLRSVFEKLRFCDWLVWKEGLTVGKTAAFLNSSGVVWTGP